MTIENIAAEIVEKLPELVRDNRQNAQDAIAGIINNGLVLRVDDQKSRELESRSRTWDRNIEKLHEHRRKLLGCAWSYNDMHDYYDTQCGSAICFNEGSAHTNQYSFCPVCGGKINFIIQCA